jgi:hypothetical protein
MSGMAEMLGLGRHGGPPIARTASIGIESLGSGGRAPAARLSFLGAGGLAVPRLDGTPCERRILERERAAAAVAANFVRAGIGCEEDWSRAGHDPFRFLKLGLERWVSAHGGDDIARHFELSLVLSSSVERYEPAGQKSGELFFLVEPGSAGYVVLAPTIDLLERIRPRMGATFFQLFVGSLCRWVRVYDFRNAEDRIQMLREWYESDPEEGAYELPDVAGSIPAAIRRRPLHRRTVEQMIERLENGRAKRILTGVLELADQVQSSTRPELDDSIQEALSDCNPPLPALLAVFRRGDVIEACFDEESQSMMEVYPEPTLIVPVDSSRANRISDALKILGTACDTLARASRLIDILPGNED